MNLARNLIQAAMGGLLAGSLLGLVEAVYQIASAGAPDLLAPFYAWALYGALGLGIGLGGGVLLSVVARSGRVKADAARAFAAGAATAIAPMLLFILFYVVNKEVYAEAGIPNPSKLGILGVVGGLAITLLTLGTTLLRGGLGFLLRGPGAIGTWGAGALATFGVSLIPTGGDPFADLEAQEASVPDTLELAPDVLVIAVDTLRADYLGTYGKEGNPTPTIDAFAADAVVFEQHIAQASWTRSSFASLFTSRIPSSHNADKKASRLADDAVLLSEALQAAGVRTGNLANNINVTSTFNFDQGYDLFVYESPAYPFGATESVFGLTFYKVVHKLSERIGPKLGIGKQVETFYQPAEVVLDHAKRFIEASDDARWMLGVHLMEPHDPYFEHPYLDGTGDAAFNGVGYARAEHEHPDPKDAEYLKKVYLDEIKHLDNKLAPFFAWLKESGRYDDLMIVLTADHGEEFNEHGGFWHGTTLYDEQIRIPLIIKLPKGELKGTRVAWQSRAIDVAPTITQAVGAEPGAGWMGQDLLNDVRETVREDAERAGRIAAARAAVEAARAAAAGLPDDATLQAALTIAEAEVQRMEEAVGACRTYGWDRHRAAVSEEDFEGNVVAAFRDGAIKLIKAAPGGPRGLPEQELFDVAADPGETRGLGGTKSHPCLGEIDALTQKITESLDTVVAGAKASAAQGGGDAALADDEIRKLCLLGYMSGPECVRVGAGGG